MTRVGDTIVAGNGGGLYCVFMASMIGTVAGKAAEIVSGLKPDQSKCNWKDALMITAILVAAVAATVFGFLADYYYCAGLAFLGLCLIFGEIHVRKYSEIKSMPKILDDMKGVTVDLASEREQFSSQNKELSTKVKSLDEKLELLASCAERIEEGAGQWEGQQQLRDAATQKLLEMGGQMQAAMVEQTRVEERIVSQRKQLELAQQMLSQEVARLRGGVDELRDHTKLLEPFNRAIRQLQLEDQQRPLQLTDR